MSIRTLLVAGLLGVAITLGGCVGDGGYGAGYGYDGDYYDGPDVGVYGGLWGPGYYVGPGHFRGGYAPRGPRGGRPPAYRPARGGGAPPSMPHGVSRGGGGFHGGGGGAPRGGGGGGPHGR